MSATAGTLWNGPVCPTCGARYLGAHTCTREDLARRIAELQRVMDSLPDSGEPRWPDTRSCPCRPENGGSGVCGCIIGGGWVTNVAQ